MKPLSEIIELQNGKGLTRANHQQGIYTVYGGNGIIGTHNQYFIEESTIIIGRVGEYCGAVHLSKPKSWVTDNSMFVNSFLTEDDKKYLYYTITHLNLNLFANKGSQPNISQSIVLDKKIPIISPENQVKLVAEIEKCEAKIKEAQEVINGITKRKETVIYEYL
jgi:restriction endonuclease S subunit